jgi:hypothetical protein
LPQHAFSRRVSFVQSSSSRRSPTRQAPTVKRKHLPVTSPPLLWTTAMVCVLQASSPYAWTLSSLSTTLPPTPCSSHEDTYLMYSMYCWQRRWNCTSSLQLCPCSTSGHCCCSCSRASGIEPCIRHGSFVSSKLCPECATSSDALHNTLCWRLQRLTGQTGDTQNYSVDSATAQHRTGQQFTPALLCEDRTAQHSTPA